MVITIECYLKNEKFIFGCFIRVMFFVFPNETIRSDNKTTPQPIKEVFSLVNDSSAVDCMIETTHWLFF